MSDERKKLAVDYQKLTDLLSAFKDAAQSREVHPRAAVFVCGMLAGIIGDSLVEDDVLSAADAKDTLRGTFNEGMDFVMDQDHTPGVLQ